MAMHQKGLIVCDPKILNGKPIIKGTRISVAGYRIHRHHD